MKGAMAGVAGNHHQQGNNSHHHHHSTTPYSQEVESAREVAKQAHQDRQELQDEESQKRAQHLEELALLESQLLKYIADRVRDDSFLVREKSWVGIDVNAVEVPDESWAEENGSVPESVEEGEEGDTLVTKLAVAQDNDDGVEDEDEEHQDLKLLGDVNGDYDHHKSGEENIEDTEDDHAVSLEKLKQELVRVQDEKTRLLKGDSNLEEPSVDIIIKEEVRKTMDADAEVEQAGGGLEEPSAVSSPPPDQVEQLNKGPESEIGMKDEDENQGDLEKQSSEKEAVLELAGQLAQLRSVGNSVESITKDVEDDDGFESIIEAPDTGLEGFVHGQHRRLDSLAARRLDFEAIDFDQFGDQPPELPLIDNPEEGEPPWDQIIGAVELPNPEEGEGERSEADKLNLHVEQMNGQTENELEGEPTEVKGEATEPDGQGEKEVPGNMNEGSQDLITQTGSPEESEMTTLDEVNQEPEENSPQTDVAKDMLPEEPESHQGDSMLQDPPPVSEGHQSDTVDGDLDKFIFEDDRLPSELPTGGDGDELEHGEVTPHSGPRIDLYQVTPHRDEELLAEDDEIASISSADSGSMRRSKRKMEVKYYPADEELQKRTDELDRLASEQAKELKEISNQVVALNLQLEEEGLMREELSNQVNTLTLQLEGQVNGREELANQVSTLTLQLEEQGKGREELGNQVGTLTLQLEDQTHMQEKLGNQVGTLSQQLEEQTKLREELGNQVGTLTQQLEEQTRMREELGNQVGTLMQQLEEQTRIREELGNQVGTLMQQLEEQTRIREELGNQISILTLQLEEQTRMREELGSQVSTLTAQLEEQTKLREELGSQVSAFTLQLEQQTNIQEELWSQVSNLTAALEEQTKLREELGSQINALTVQLEDQSRMREELGSQVDTLTLQLEEQSRMRETLGNQINTLTLQLEEQTQMREELEGKLEEERTERLKSETQLMAVSEMSPKQDEKLKELSDQLATLTMLLEEQTKMREDLEGKLDQECRERLESESKMSTANESLPVSSMMWSDDASSPVSFAKLLEEQKELLATQMKEAEKLQTAAEQKVGLLNHKVQDLEVISDAAGKLENVLMSKEKVLRQVLWTSFQACFLGIALLLFFSKFQDPMRNSLRPT